MWVGAEDYRGNGLNTQNELVPGSHIEAPSKVAPLIALKINQYD